MYSSVVGCSVARFDVSVGTRTEFYNLGTRSVCSIGRQSVFVRSLFQMTSLLKHTVAFIGRGGGRIVV